MLRRFALAPLWFAAVLVAGCATPSAEVKPLAANPAEFATWDCSRIDDELDRVQQRAADVAYTVDERAGNNIVALGVGLAIFWPTILAMRPDGLEAAELARLKGRFEALRVASARKSCPPAGSGLSASRAASFPVALGERLVYEERSGARGPMVESGLRVMALRRDEIEFRSEPAATELQWRQDLAGNVIVAPEGSLRWRRLLRADLELGQVTAGDIDIVGEPLLRARVRGQVVAVGPQLVAGRRFDVAVIELFGDVQRGEASTRLEGAIVVDRSSGVLLRLDLVSAQREFSLQRRLARVEAVVR
ncbi:MAG: hypothetical protein Q8N44_11450 [Rubrivivax sp.]|nr:hypothetical protein [Rubrivivax sp.]